MKILRPTWAEVDLANIALNINAIKDFVGSKVGILAVVKADAYGHELVKVAAALENTPVNMFGVATVEEGIQLRQSGIKKDILILGSIYPFKNFKEVVNFDLTPTVASVAGLEALEKYCLKSGKRVPFHLKIDTGMARIGLSPSTAAVVLPKIRKLKKAYMEGIYTHLACGDTQNDFTKTQFLEFKKIVSRAKSAYKHIAASASIINYRNSYFNLVRPGLLIYGLLPFKNAANYIPVKPALELKTKIVFLKSVPKNTSISYGRTFYTGRASRVATVPIGYADGLSRHNSNNAHMIVNGRKVPVVGSVCMDMTMLNVTGIPGVSVGSEVVVIGSQGGQTITAEDVAAGTRTINYEVLTSISKRVPRIYKGI